MAAQGVGVLLEQLRAKYNTVEEAIQADQYKKAELERKLVQETDNLGDINQLLDKQKKLLRQYNNQLDEAEQAIKNLSRQSAKFADAFGKVNKSNQSVRM